MLIPRSMGKIVGFLLGFFWGQHIFAVFVGVLVGHQFDRGLWGSEKSPLLTLDNLGGKKRVYFIRVLFNVMGHVAKADGRVSKEEIDVARGIMAELKLTPEELDMAVRAYTEGKNPDFPLASNLSRFYDTFSKNIALREWFVRIQIQAALAGDGLSRTVDKLLHATAAQVDLPKPRMMELIREARIYNSFTVYGRKKEKDHYDNKYDYQSRKRRKNNSRYNTDNDESFSRGRRNYQRGGERQYADPVKHAQNTLAEAYILLGVSAADDAKAIKRAYRRLISQHHPDKLIGQGAGSAERELAHAKTIEIREAYELISEKRGF